jgi:hypothetical protein
VRIDERVQLKARKMDLFRLGIFEHVTARQREATISKGGFVVAACDEWGARMLVTLNCAIAVKHRPGENTVTNIWNDSSASYCERVVNAREANFRQKRVVRGVDLAPSHLSHQELRSGEEVVARMVWWPCRPSEKCPI